MQGSGCLTGEYGMRGTRGRMRPAGRAELVSPKWPVMVQDGHGGLGQAGGRVFLCPDGQRAAPSWPTSVTRTTAAPASSEAARSISALMPQS